MLLLQSWYLCNLGIYNFCNPGAISHNEVLDLYKKHIDPSYVYTNFSLDEQAQILKAGRSNNTLGNFMIEKNFPWNYCILCEQHRSISSTSYLLNIYAVGRLLHQIEDFLHLSLDNWWIFSFLMRHNNLCYYTDHLTHSYPSSWWRGQSGFF